MQLTPLQLQIQERADKTLSFGCMIEGPYLHTNESYHIIYDIVKGYKKEVYRICKYGTEYTYEMNTITNIIGHPMNWGRLWYLYNELSNSKEKWNKWVYAGGNVRKLLSDFDYICVYFKGNQNCYLQTVLERPVELQELVLAFLNTLGPL